MARPGHQQDEQGRPGIQVCGEDCPKNVEDKATRCDLATTGDLTAYLAAWVRGALERTLTRDDLLPIHPPAYGSRHGQRARSITSTRSTASPA